MLSLSVFTLRSLGDLATLMIIAKRHNITTLDELQSLVGKEIDTRLPKESKSVAERRLEQHKVRNKKLPVVPCSRCGSHTRILPVNDTPATQVGGDWNSCTLCYDGDCRHVEYYTETAKELLEKAK